MRSWFMLLRCGGIMSGLLRTVIHLLVVENRQSNKHAPFKYSVMLLRASATVFRSLRRARVCATVLSKLNHKIGVDMRTL
jgi:hypothetical protein